jgi:dTDP-4-dehydrorhamnose reductase
MSDAPRILLIGSDGQVGWELRRTLAPVGQVIAASMEGRPGRPSICWMHPRVRRVFNEAQPDAVVNAAAYTAVDKAESEPESPAPSTPMRCMCWRSWPRAPVCRWCTTRPISSSRAHRAPLPRGRRAEPVSVYGETKRAGELALLDSAADALVLRTAWLYGVRGRNFLLTMRNLFRERNELRIVDDQVGTPTWSRMLAEVTAQVMHAVFTGAVDIKQVKGLYHVTSSGAVSWYGFASAIRDATCNRLRADPDPHQRVSGAGQAPGLLGARHHQVPRHLRADPAGLASVPGAVPGRPCSEALIQLPADQSGRADRLRPLCPMKRAMRTAVDLQRRPLRRQAAGPPASDHPAPALPTRCGRRAGHRGPVRCRCAAGARAPAPCRCLSLAMRSA